MNKAEPVRLLTLKWLLPLWSCRYRMCVGDQCGLRPRTVSREAGTAE